MRRPAVRTCSYLMVVALILSMACDKCSSDGGDYRQPNIDHLGTPYVLNSSEIEIIVDVHNEMRANAKPPPTNMLRIVRDSDKRIDYDTMNYDYCIDVYSDGVRSLLTLLRNMPYLAT